MPVLTASMEPLSARIPSDIYLWLAQLSGGRRHHQ